MLTMRSMLLWSLLPLAALCGCAGLGGGDKVVVTSAYEISDNPVILTDYAMPIDKMTLRGVALGSLKSGIDPDRILSEDPNGWIICRDMCRYRVLDGQVVTLGAWDQKALSQLGVKEEADIERIFGKAEAVEKVDTLSTKMTIYRFANGERRASWDRILNRLSTVNVGASYVIPKPGQP